MERRNLLKSVGALLLGASVAKPAQAENPVRVEPGQIWYYGKLLVERERRRGDKCKRWEHGFAYILGRKYPSAGGPFRTDLEWWGAALFWTDEDFQEDIRLWSVNPEYGDWVLPIEDGAVYAGTRLDLLKEFVQTCGPVNASMSYGLTPEYAEKERARKLREKQGYDRTEMER